jgi:hypothetical protein
MAKVTHHQRGAFPSTAPEIRSVIQEKFRRFKTSGTRASGLSTEAEASPAITSGAVVAPSILGIFDFRFSIFEWGKSGVGAAANKSKIEIRNSKIH